MRFVLGIILICLCCTLRAQIHVFYLHGRIIEVQGADAVETTNGYGPYKYNAIIDSLKAKQFIVHSEVRAQNTEVNSYAQKISTQVKELLQQGVKPSNICIIGASKGAAIAIKVAELCNNANLKYVLLAGCCDDNSITLAGQILSIYEQSDNCQTCLNNLTAAAADSVIEELQLNTGLRHGFFYTPISSWFAPTVNWAKGQH